MEQFDKEEGNNAAPDSVQEHFEKQGTMQYVICSVADNADRLRRGPVFNTRENVYRRCIHGHLTMLANTVSYS